MHWRAMGHSYGVPVGSDWADKADSDGIFGLYKRCGSFCLEEVCILFECARQLPGIWLDIGAHTGWTTLHLLEAGRLVAAVEPMWRVEEFKARALENMDGANGDLETFDMRSDEFFAGPAAIYCETGFSGVVIDGDHDEPCPINDAKNAHKHLAKDGVILFHDAIGRPVQDGILWLIEQGYKCKVYSTPHVVACCWRGDFVPPEHVADPRVKTSVREYLGGIAEYA